MTYNILICDDEQDIINALKIYLSSGNYEFFEAHTGTQALQVLETQEIHIVLLDIMMPVLDGISTLSQIRKVSNVPVILLTAKSEDADIILGLDVGADDYITKPFSPVEVAARVRSQLRRYMHLGGSEAHSDKYIVGGIELDDRTKVVTLDGDAVALTPKEYEILKLLISNPDKVFSPKEIYANVWKEPCVGTSENTVAVHIRHLREKLEINPAQPRYLKVVFGQGYKMERGKGV